MGRTTPDLRALVDTYLEERAARHECTPLSLWNFRCALLNFANAMGDRPVSSIDRAAVEEWMATRHRLSAATRRHNLSVVRTFCQWLVRRGYLPVDPTAEIPPVRVPRHLPRALPESKVGKLLSAVPDARGVLIVLLMVQEGLRCARSPAYRSATSTLRGLTTRVIGKGGHHRLLPISDETRLALLTYFGAVPGDQTGRGGARHGLHGSAVPKGGGPQRALVGLTTGMPG